MRPPVGREGPHPIFELLASRRVADTTAPEAARARRRGPVWRRRGSGEGLPAPSSLSGLVGKPAPRVLPSTCGIEPPAVSGLWRVPKPWVPRGSRPHGCENQARDSGPRTRPPGSLRPRTASLHRGRRICADEPSSGVIVCSRSNPCQFASAFGLGFRAFSRGVDSPRPPRSCFVCQGVARGWTVDRRIVGARSPRAWG